MKLAPGQASKVGALELHNVQPRCTLPSMLGSWRARGALALVGLVASAVATAQACAPDSELPDQQTFCDPGSFIFCRCQSGEPGVKECSADGNTFAACEAEEGGPCPERAEVGGAGPSSSSGTPGAGGGGSGGGGPGGGTGTGELLSPCGDGGDCATGLCPLGFCTQPCAEVTDCPTGASECVDLAIQRLCVPTCGTLASPDPTACGVYSSEVTCGFAKAVDDWAITVCSAWGPLLELPPQGTECSFAQFGDVQCNLGHEGLEAVCDNGGVCAKGCFGDVDCPDGEGCSSDGNSLGNCF